MHHVSRVRWRVLFTGFSPEAGVGFSTGELQHQDLWVFSAVKVTSPKSSLSLTQGTEGAGRNSVSFEACILEPEQAEGRIPA